MNEWHTRSVVIASLTLAVACSTVRYSADYDRQASFSGFHTYGWETLSEDEQAALARVDPFLERRLQRAVDLQLADRGFVENSQGDPDFWVSVYPVIATQAGGSDRGSAPGYPLAVAPRSGVNVSVGFGHPYWFGFPYFGFWTPYFGYPLGFGYWNRFGYRYPFHGFGPYWRHPRFGFYPGFGVGYTTARGVGYPAAGAVSGLGFGTVVVDVTDARTDELVWRGWAEGALQEAPGTNQLTAYIDEVVTKIMKDFPPPNASR